MRSKALSWRIRAGLKTRTPRAWVSCSDPSFLAEELYPCDVWGGGLNGGWVAASSWWLLGVARKIVPLRIAFHTYSVGRYFGERRGANLSIDVQQALRFAALAADGIDIPELGKGVEALTAQGSTALKYQRKAVYLNWYTG
jgi:hypothetical protein